MNYYRCFKWVQPVGCILLLLMCMHIVHAQNTSTNDRFKVTGRVTDQKGQLLPAVSVTEVNTNNGTTTDSSGTYTIYVSGKTAVLTFSIIGYKTRRAGVQQNGLLDMAMEENITENEKVIVVGFGVQKKASVVGAISTIEPQKLQLTPSRSISNNLAGMVSGVLAVQRSGDPSNNNSDFWIRGISTLGNSNSRPLVLIDGVERPINDIDPEEIESFSVLKDASASAVYGVRGANGVIMINTKRGKIGSPKVSVRFEKAFTSPTQLPEYVGSVKYLEIMNEIYKNSGQPVPFASEDRLNNYRNNTDPELYPDIDWWDVVSKDYADNMRLNANVSGGNNFLRYALELGYFDENGLIERDPKQAWNSSLKVKRYNVRSNVDVNLTPTTLLRFNIGGYLQTKNAPPSGTDFDIFYQASMTPPYIHPPVYSTGQFPRVQYRENPWAFATQRGYVVLNQSRLESLASLEQELNFLKGLRARFTFSFDRYSGNSVNRTKDPDYYFPAQARDANGNLILSIQSNGQQFLGYSTGAEWGYQSMYLESQISYSRIFDKHNVNGMLLYNQRNYDNGDRLPFRNQGLAGRASYTFDRRYIAEFNFGYNGSENFAAGNRFGFFPAVAAGWILTEETFMENIRNTVSMLKIRGSWGKAGNSDIGGRRFAYISTIENSGSYRWGVNADYYRLGRAEGEVGVDNLTWETVAKSNIGLELGLWQGAINLQVDLFKEKRKDIFIQRSNVPGSAGFSRPIWANFGKVNNEGLDMSVNGRKQITKDWSVSVLANYTYAHNTIIEKDEPLSIKGTTRSLTGKPVNQIVGLIAEGLFTDKDFNPDGTLKAGVPEQRFSGKIFPGDIKYRDLNGDGQVTNLDQTSIGGTTDPQVVYGFGLNVAWKAIDFGFFFQGAGKTTRLLGGQNWIPGSSNAAAGNILSNIDDRWTIEEPRQDVFWPRLSKDLNANNTQPSTWWLRDMSFLRLRNVELGYSLPATWIKHAGMSNCRFFVRGANILTFSTFKLWDPELGTTDGLKYPIMKSVSGGLVINFL
jgi:TonB-linked SusC/RagA family outer membrane protein